VSGPQVAVVGAGVQMRRHLLPVLIQAGCTIAAVIDSDMDRAGDLAERLGAFAAGALSAIADSIRVDAVVAACPPLGHEQVIRDAIAMGTPVLVEKPPACSAMKLQELAALARSAGVPVCVGMNYRHAPGFRALRSRLVGEGRHIEYAHVMHLVSGGPIKDWDLEPLRCFMLAQAIHPVDEALALIGAPEAAEVVATCDGLGHIRATWTLRRHDCVGTVHVGNCGPGFRNTVTALGSDGTIAELRNLDELSVIEAAGHREFREQLLLRTPFAEVIDRLGFSTSVLGFLAAHADHSRTDGVAEPVRLDDLVGCYDLLESAIASCIVLREDA
jgi:phthalate 4,5-cis-dihydrodiol dehydrogenase